MIGRTVSHYRILEELGRGGMGIVYKAHDTKLDRPAALKVLKPELLEDEEHRQRFLREARSAAAVTHPFIASIYDAGEAEGTLFIAMEFVEGKTLRALLSKGFLPILEVQQYATEVAEGLATAHQSNLVHRDLKPDNVMVAKNGHVKILDFGLAKIVEKRDEAATVTLGKMERPEFTMEGAILGTPAYMSPEQARGEPVDWRSDVFSFGTMLYEMATGTSPFRRATPQETIASILRDSPVPPNIMNAQVATDLDTIIERCLQKQPDERYGDMHELVVALRDTGLTPKAEVPASSVTPSRRPRRRRLLLSVAAALAVVTGGRMLWNRRDVPPPPPNPTTPTWTLVADFDAPAEEPELGVAVREFVAASLEQSRIVTPIQRATVRRAIELAGYPDTTRVADTVAAEIAVRGGASTYITGRIDRVLSGFSLVFRVVDVKQGRTVASSSGIAEAESELLPTMRELAQDIASKLGASKSALTPVRNYGNAITPSYEAFRKFVQAIELVGENRQTEAIPYLKEALEFDPDFAMAWLWLGVVPRPRAEARDALQEAIRRPERLTKSQLLYARHYLARLDCNDLEAWQLLDQALREDPFNIAALSSRAVMSLLLGRDEQALAGFQRQVEVDPLGGAEIEFDNMMCTLVHMGRYDEARQLLPKLDGFERQLAELNLAVAGSQWAWAERLGAAYAGDPTFDSRMQIAGRRAAASIRAMHGRVRRAFEDLHELARKRADVRTCFAQLLLSTTSGMKPEYFDQPVGTRGGEGLVAQTMIAWVCGDTALVQDTRAQLDSIVPAGGCRTAFDGDGVAVVFLEAWLASEERDWRRVVELLEPLHARRMHPFVDFRVPVLWLEAQAQQELGDFEQATDRLEALIAPDGFSYFVDATLLPIHTSFARQKLVVLYSRLGRVEDARRHWEIFQKTFTNPDPELLPMIEEARQALAGAEAEAKI